MLATVKKEYVLVFVLISGIILVYLYAMLSGTPISKYIPKNEDEQHIMTLISTFHQAGLNHDLGTYLACLDDGGSFMFSGSLMVSKVELAKLLPTFWQELESGNMLVMANSRESLNGNFLSGRFYNPVIVLKGKEAEAVVTFITPVLRWKTKLFLQLQKQKGYWLIHHLAWATG